MLRAKPTLSLSDSAALGTSIFMNDAQRPAEIFDARRKQAKLSRAFAQNGSDDFLWQYLAEEIGERLSIVTREFTDILLIGPSADYAPLLLGERKGNVTAAQLCAAKASAKRHALIDGEILPFATGDFDLVICFGVLDAINDLPGFLFQLRHILRPDGLLLANAFGAGTLGTLKQAMLRAEGDRAAPHIHPQIDLHAMSQLTVRAGFALPVIDQDTLTVRYSAIHALLADLRNMGLGNILAGPRSYFGKAAYAALLHQWQAKADEDGKTAEQFNFLQITAWAPSPDQPKPAKRGSGKTSLADVLKPREPKA